MKKMLLGLAAVFALTSLTRAFAEDPPAKTVKVKAAKKPRLVKKPLTGKVPEAK